MNIFQSILKSATQPRSPLHAGEVFILWSLYVGVVESRVICQLVGNHTNDTSLKETIEHFINDLEEPLTKRLKDFLAHEGIGIPPGTGDKPRTNEALIPPGAKFTDAEIANLLVVKVEGLLNLCHAGLGQSLRDDVGLMLAETYQHVLAQGFTLKKLMRQRGWLRVPPLFPFGPAVGGE
ncbi:MAG: DUF3231 family protein [Mycobacterium leprae]